MSFPDKQKNKEHLKNPKPGDYWSEMLCGICVILEVTEHNVILCRTKKDVGNDKWTWDLTKRETMTRSEFEKWLCYGTKPGVTWCEVRPEAHKWVLDCEK